MLSQQPLYLTSFFRAVGIPILLWIAFTPFSGWLDLHISPLFFENGKFASNAFLEGLFQYGYWPAWVLTGIAILGLVLAILPHYRHWWRPCLLMILTFAIGSGLIIHLGLKEHWGRPRPRQVVEFGGSQPFRPYYQPSFSKQSEHFKSFSCGHCSTGFTFFSLAILGTYYRSRLFWWLGWGLAWGLGVLLSIARIAQGGHFLSDVLASALIMWITAWCLASLLIVQKGYRDERLDL